MERNDYTICPHCGHPNPYAPDDGAVDGPREYHADCWDDAAQADAIEAEVLREELERLRDEEARR